jgi:hypothetical protein
MFLACHHLLASLFRKRPSKECCLNCTSNLSIEGDVLLTISFVMPLLLNCFYPKLFCQPLHNSLVLRDSTGNAKFFSTLIFSSRVRTLYAIVVPPVLYSAAESAAPIALTNCGSSVINNAGL